MDLQNIHKKLFICILVYISVLEEIPPEETTVVSILDQLAVSNNDPNENKNNPGVANFARIPLTKFKMKEDSEEDSAVS